MKQIRSALESTILWADLHGDITPEEAIREVVAAFKKELFEGYEQSYIESDGIQEVLIKWLGWTPKPI